MYRLPSDPFLSVAFWVGIVSVALTLLVALLVLNMRLRLRRSEAHWKRFMTTWRPILMQAMVQPGLSSLPKLKPGQYILFMRLWIYLHESVRGEAAQRLNEVARALGIDVVARKLLHHGSRRRKLLAIMSLGHLRDSHASNELLFLAEHSDGLLSVNAGRALIQIDPIAGVQSLMPLIVRREDWDITRVASFLGPAREAFLPVLVESIPQVPENMLARVLLLSKALRLKLPTNTMYHLLSATQPADVIVAALSLAESRDLVGEIRRCTAHSDHRVREQAIRQLAVLGDPSDVKLLTDLMEDTQWSVRLAAAESLAALPFMSNEELAALRRPGSLAESILDHVLAQRSLA